MTQEYLNEIIEEFKELKAQIESMTFDEVMDTYCTFGESDNEVELDVDCDDGNILAVYIDKHDDGSVTVSADNITVYGEAGGTAVVYLAKELEEPIATLTIRPAEFDKAVWQDESGFTTGEQYKSWIGDTAVMSLQRLYEHLDGAEGVDANDLYVLGDVINMLSVIENVEMVNGKS